jgi:phage terminase small subunit
MTGHRELVGHRPALKALPGGDGLPALGEPFLPLGPVGLRAWELLAAAPWVRETDGILASMFCQGLQEREALRALIAASPTVKGSRNNPRPNPATAQLRALEKQLGEWARLLLLDPRQRTELGIATAKARTKLDELRDRREARGPANG